MTATGDMEKRIWISTADFGIQVYGYKNVGDPQCLWTFHMKDSVLALDTEVEGWRVKRVFASLANGTLCVFSRTTDTQCQKDSLGDAKLIPDACTVSCDDEQYRREAEEWANPFILLLGESRKAAKCMVFVRQDQLWCGCGNTINVVDIAAMKVLKSIPVFVKKMALVNELVSNGNRVWGVGRQLLCVMEWDTKMLSLLHVFNCNIIDPTGDKIISDSKLINDLYDPEATRQPSATFSEGTGGLTHSSGRFTVKNDPKTAAPFSQRGMRCTLKGVRKRAVNIKEDVNPTGKALVSSTRDLVRHRQKGSTRTTSLLILKETLWVAHGMGDILIIDISGGENHGKVHARLATEDCEKYRNKSYHKLVCVASEYVVSSQWLEPVDIRARVDDSVGMAHQAITIWNA